MGQSVRTIVSAWMNGFSTRTSADEDRFDQEQIVRIVAAGESGTRIADLCAAEGIAPETYYVWKVKYSGLTPAEVLDHRLRERKKVHTTSVALAGMVVVTCASACVLLASRTVVQRGRSTPAPASSTVHLPQPGAPSSSAPVPQVAGVAPTPSLGQESKPSLPPTTNVVQVTAPPVSVARILATSGGIPPNVTSAETEVVATSEPAGYPVQVVAVPDPVEARAWAASLREAGYNAYVTATRPDPTAMYRVRVGPLKSRQEAEEVAHRLESEGFPTPWVVQYR